MFDRHQRTAGNPNGRHQARLTMNDGEIVDGAVALPLSGKLAEAMNGTGGFLDVETADGSQFFIAKHALRRLDPVNVPRADQLHRRGAEMAVFDPHAILGLAKGASPEDLRRAYHDMVKAYHPDRFATLDLPPEMRAYASAMLVRINIAHEQLSRQG